jgi:DNA-binding NtrC family response regulator
VSARREKDDVVTQIQARSCPDLPSPSTFRLVVVDGIDSGTTFVLDGKQPTRALVGQGPACELRLRDAEVSRRHVALEPTPEGVRITDLGSTNGTFVDRVRVIEAILLGDEVVQIGSTLLRVERVEHAPSSPPEAEGFGRLLGTSVAMRRLYPLCQKIAASNVPVIIEGETGTGKEILAESLHEAGPRAAGPFVVFDCTAVPPNLVESELFGHERGAFTGAIASRPGVFEQAHGGTLLIDEVGDLELTLQPKLLRALERHEIRRVGGSRWSRVDVRVLAATRRDLDREVTAGRFRDDLFHRLSVIRVELPALRHRREDVAPLARHFWRELGGEERLLPEGLLMRWEQEPWPGNVRELRNVVARQLALGELASTTARGKAIERSVGPAEEPGSGVDSIETLLAMRLPFTEARDRLAAVFERRFVERTLADHGGDVVRAAAASGIGRRYFEKLRARSR